jgi:thioredoxin reductase
MMARNLQLLPYRVKGIQQYKTVEIVEGVATTAIDTGNGFTVQTASGQAFHSRKLILATGLKDIMPDIKGFEDCWGKSVNHCPYCHGYEYAHKATAILGNGDAGYSYAELISNWTKDLVVFTDGPSSFTDQQLAKINKHNVRVIESPVEAILHENGQLHQVYTKDGQLFNVSAIYNKPKTIQHSDIPQALGCEISEHGLIKVDEFRQTTVKGVFACGDNSSMRSVAVAVSTGSVTGSTVNKALIEEDF